MQSEARRAHSLGLTEKSINPNCLWNEGGGGGKTHGEAPAAVWYQVLDSRTAQSVTDRSSYGQGGAVLCLCKEKGPVSAQFPHCSQLLLPPLPMKSPAWVSLSEARAALQRWDLC